MKKLLGTGEKVFIFIVLFVVLYAFAATTTFTIVFSVKYNAPIQSAENANNDLYIDENSETICYVEVFRTTYDDGIIENNIEENYELSMSPDDCILYLKNIYGYSDDVEYNEYTGTWGLRVTIDYPIEMQENYYYIRVDLAW